MEVVHAIENTPRGQSDKPNRDIKIVASGVVERNETEETNDQEDEEN